MHRVVVALFVFLAFVSCAKADTQTWDDNQTSFCLMPGCTTATMNIVMVTQTETGDFNNAWLQEIESGTFPVVISMTGTFKGQPITFVDDPWSSDPIEGWLWFGVPQEIQFMAGGVLYDFQYDGSRNVLVAQDGTTYYFTVGQLDPLPIPEPSSWFLLAMGILPVAIAARSRHHAAGGEANQRFEFESAS